METIISASQEAILACVKSSVGGVDRRSADPLSGLFLIEKRGALVSITASNTESQTTSTATLGPPRGDTSLAIDARKLVEIIRSVPTDQVVMVKSHSGKAVIRAGRSEFKLQTRPGEDFQLFVPEPYLGTLTMPQRLLTEQLEQVTYAMAGAVDHRPYLQGAFIRSEKLGMCMVACDSHRMAFADRLEVLVTGAPSAFVLPRKVALELKRLLTVSDDPVLISVGRRQVEFKFADVVIISKLIDGSPPDYRAVIPKAVDVEVVVERRVLADSLARMAVMAGSSPLGVNMALQSGVLALDLASDNGEAHEQVDVEYAGADEQFAFNVHYLTATMAAIPADQVALGFSTKGGPLLVRSADKTGPVHLVMPTRVSSTADS